MLRAIAIALLSAISAFATGNCDGAGNCYVSSLATGTGSGADWTNACIDFTNNCDVTSSLIRGTTLWVGGSPGNYLGAAYQAKIFSAPALGTTPVTIIAASAANHGTDTGWRKQSATAIVLLQGPLNITTDYWTFDGQFRGVTQNSTESQGGGSYHDQLFGYHMQVSQTNGAASGAIQVSGSHVTLRYIYVQGAGTTEPTTGGPYGGTQTDNGIFYSPGVTNEYLGYSWIGWTGADSVKASSGSNFTFEYNMFTKNHTGPASLASQAISIGDLTGLIVRYNHFHDITGSGILVDANVDANAFTPNWYFYGNDIFWDTAVHGGSIAYGLGGIVVLPGETLNGGVIHVYNNTIAGINVAACGSTQSCSSVALALTGATAGTCSAHTQNCIGATAPVGTVLNNLWWNPFAATNFVNPTNAQWTPTGDYGEGICASTGCSNNGVFVVRGPNDVSVLTGNPFKSFNGVMGSPAWYNFNFLPTANTAGGLLPPGAGITPPGCNSALNCEINDPNYVTLGANGTIQRGAFQINSRTLLKVGMVNTGFGVHVGQTFNETPVCTWSSAPLTDPCPNSAAPFLQRWLSLDKTAATVDTNGVVTGVSPHNAFITLQYGGLTSGNSTVVVVTDGLGTRPVATLPTGIVRTGSPLAFSGFNTTNFDASFPTVYTDPCPTAQGCTQWRPTNATTLDAALASSQPGDTIILQAGSTYTMPIPGIGSFKLRAKANPNNKWIYIISSNIGALPPQGTRVGPNNAVNMPKLIETAANPVFTADPGANHYWLAGLELVGGNVVGLGGVQPPNSGATVYPQAPNPATATSTMPDSFTVDRCYMHAAWNLSPAGVNSGSDMQHAIILNASHFAVLDSYAGPGLTYHTQANAGAEWFSPGPLKIINNFFSGFGQDFILGGAGGFSNMWVPADAYIARNTFWNDPAWRVVGFTIPPAATYEIANNFELKHCIRCLIDGNQMQNSWFSAQAGSSVLVGNTGTGVNGPDAVIDDTTVSNNIVMGSLQGMGGTEFAAENNGCGWFDSPCQYPGESRRVNFFNNLYVMGNLGPPGGRATVGSSVAAGNITRLKSDSIWQHNTFVGPYLTDHAYCDHSLWINFNTGDTPVTSNMWLLDNVLCREVQAASPAAGGTPMLNAVMSDPTSVPVANRFIGNVMEVFTSQGDTVHPWPPNNLSTTQTFTYVSPTTGNYQLVTPVQPASDGAPQSGINYSILQAHQAPAKGNCSISGTVSGAEASGASLSLSGDFTETVQSNADGTYTFPNLAAGNYVVTPFNSIYTFTPASATVTNQTCVTTGVNFGSTANPTFTISGTITGPAANGSTVRISFNNIASTTSDPSGNYTIPGQVPGGYIVTPSLHGFVFTPMSQFVTITNANITVPTFSSAATGPTFSISGTVTAGGVPLGSVVLTLTTGATAITVTDTGTGTYIFNNIPDGSYTLSASRTGYTFVPVSIPVTVNGANVTGQNFAGTPVQNTFSISGTVNGAIAQGVTLNLTGGSNTSTVSAANGSYSFPNLPDGSYTVAPSLTGYTFLPVSRAVTINGANVPGQDFVSSVQAATAGLHATHIGPGTGRASKPKEAPK